MTTKIQLKLTNDVLLTVLQMIQHLEGFEIDNLTNALLESIREDLIAKLEEKAKTIQRQTSILDHNKKNGVILKYHEAYTLYKLLEKVVENGFFTDNQHFKKIQRLIIELESKVLIVEKEKEETTYHTPLLFNLNTDEEILVDENSITNKDDDQDLHHEASEQQSPVEDLKPANNENSLNFATLFEVQKTGLVEPLAPVNKEITSDTTAVQIDIFSKPAKKEMPKNKDTTNTPGQTSLF